MFISDVVGISKEEVYDVILQDLRHLGLKHRIKKTACKNSQHVKHGRAETGLFKMSLNSLENEVVFLNSGNSVEVPNFIVTACMCIKQHIETEGIFRKAGSATRQRELKAFLDNGKKIGPDHNAIDVANILKLFFRELPEPLIPYAYHDLLLRCLLLKEKRIESLLMTCLLIPSNHLNCLAYLMQFFQDVASFSSVNKMDVKNLAIVITPSVMPVEEKIVVNSSSRLSHHVQVVELLITNADKIGNLPENVSEKLACFSTSHDEQEDDSRQSKKKKKRRSGSLTRMLNGLKKMVGKGTPEVDENNLITSTPDFSTPCVKSNKKRKADISSTLSSKKKKDVLQMLPQSVALATPYTPSRSMAHDLYVTSPVCAHPNPHRKSRSPQSVMKVKHRRFFTPKLHYESGTNKATGKDPNDICKKSRLSLGGRSSKKQKLEELAAVCNTLDSDVTCHNECTNHRESPELTWNGNTWEKKKYLNLSNVPVYSPSIGAGVDITSDGELPHVENSTGNMFYQETHFDLSNNVVHVSEPSCSESMELEFVRIPKSEYEAIKNRVSAIENRISQEFGNMETNENISNLVNSLELPCNKEVASNSAESVQSAYERTLEESEKLDDASTDQLARRLSKELRIRRSLEHKIIRSPSARKIGTIKRRSRENTKPVYKKQSDRNEISRNMSWHLAVRPSVSQISQLYPRSSLRRGRPNTVFSGLPQPNPRNISDMENTRITLKYHPNQNSMDVNKTPDPLQSFTNSEIMNMTDFSQYLGLCKDLDGPLTRNRAQRACSFSGTEWAFRNQNFISDSPNELRKSNSQGDLGQTKVENCPILHENQISSRSDMKNEQEKWQRAETFFTNNPDEKQEVPATGRASIAKLRSQNAGMVMERMKMFDPKAVSKVEPSEKDRVKVEIKSKKNVQVPSIFACNAEATASIRMQSSRSTPTKKRGFSRIHQGQSLQRVNSSMRSKTNIGTENLRETYKDSPKKIGTPRRKQSMKSPNGSLRRQKLKIMKSPSKVDPNCPNTATTIKRKHNSLKIARDKVCPAINANMSAPDHWLATEKENVQSPADSAHLQPNLKSISVKDQAAATVITADICSPVVEKSSKIFITPLKDSNRINNHILSLSSKEQMLERCPVETPFIKKPLLAKTPGHFTKTPQGILSADRSGRRQNTPMKALAGFSTIATPVGSLKRQSPRLLLLKSRNIS